MNKEIEELKGDMCPICGYLLDECQCIYAGSCHPDRSKREDVVLHHLYLLNERQLRHVINLQAFKRASYAKDDERNAIIKDLGWEYRI